MPSPDLLDPRTFGYGRATAEVTAAGRTWRLAALDGFESNVQTVYRRLAGRTDGRDPGDWMPMFGVLWPGAAALTERVARAELGGLHVLELGCGLAVPSLAAADGGARVVATDNHPHFAAFLHANARHNQVAVHTGEAPPAPGSVHAAHLDWRAPEQAHLQPRSFQRVIASDLLFSPDLAPLVARVIHYFLADDGVAWMVDPGRLALAAFEQGAAECGLVVDLEVIREAETELFELTIRR